jgi:hypothetical protein
MAEPKPKPCKRYAKRMVWNDRFIRHPPTCEACKGVIAYLRSDSALRDWLRRHRN